MFRLSRSKGLLRRGAGVRISRRGLCCCGMAGLGNRDRRGSGRIIVNKSDNTARTTTCMGGCCAGVSSVFDHGKCVGVGGGIVVSNITSAISSAFCTNLFSARDGNRLALRGMIALGRGSDIRMVISLPASRRVGDIACAILRASGSKGPISSSAFGCAIANRNRIALGGSGQCAMAGRVAGDLSSRPAPVPATAPKTGRNKGSQVAPVPGGNATNKATPGSADNATEHSMGANSSAPVNM